MPFIRPKNTWAFSQLFLMDRDKLWGSEEQARFVPVNLV